MGENGSIDKARSQQVIICVPSCELCPLQPFWTLKTQWASTAQHSVVTDEGPWEPPPPPPLFLTNFAPPHLFQTSPSSLYMGRWRAGGRGREGGKVGGLVGGVGGRVQCGRLRGLCPGVLPQPGRRGRPRQQFPRGSQPAAVGAHSREHGAPALQKRSGADSPLLPNNGCGCHSLPVSLCSVLPSFAMFFCLKCPQHN